MSIERGFLTYFLENLLISVISITQPKHIFTSRASLVLYKLRVYFTKYKRQCPSILRVIFSISERWWDEKKTGCDAGNRTIAWVTALRDERRKYYVILKLIPFLIKRYYLKTCTQENQVSPESEKKREREGEREKERGRENKRQIVIRDQRERSSIESVYNSFTWKKEIIRRAPLRHTGMRVAARGNQRVK